MMPETEVMLRLLVACAVGALLGVDRELQNKAAGLKTLTLVSLASALFTLFGTTPSDGESLDSVSRVIQGIVTGVGFLGAGVIVHRGSDDSAIEGLTTAASIWLSAALGVGCGLGLWFETLFGAGAALLVLVVGRPLVDWLRKWQS